MSQQQSNGYARNCGCYSYTAYDGEGNILYVDEAVCREHFRPLWDAIKDTSSSPRFSMTPREIPNEKETPPHEEV